MKIILFLVLGCVAASASPIAIASLINLDFKQWAENTFSMIAGGYRNLDSEATVVELDCILGDSPVKSCPGDSPY